MTSRAGKENGSLIRDFGNFQQQAFLLISSPLLPGLEIVSSQKYRPVLQSILGRKPHDNGWKWTVEFLSRGVSKRFWVSRKLPASF
ncbi:MAG: hypothetical protein DKT66_24540 [Candidatus Melainabacteria bacterium]|jgi:hypothetical protein|nr:MAG: hypothetical protein DKT66_24540 [Candidatus Melainabacteria bacterium]